MPIIDFASSTTSPTNDKQVSVSQSVTSNTQNPAESDKDHSSKSRSAVAHTIEGSFPLSSTEAENRMRQAARILANGAIRAALKHHQQSQEKSPTPDVRKSDTTGKTALAPPASSAMEARKAASLDSVNPSNKQ